MKNLLILSGLFMVFNLNAKDTSYYEVLHQKIELADSSYNLESFQKMVNTCQRIIAINNTDWLPQYYLVYAYVHMAYLTTDEEPKDEFLDKAQEYYDQLIKLNSRESEIYILQALICYGRMQINPMFRSAIYFPLANESLEKAEKFNPKNPRIFYLYGQSAHYKPSFVGGGKEAAKPILVKALEYYNQAQLINRIYPDWGKKATIKLYKACLTKE